MRILGIDYGDARTGLSVSDPSGFLAGSPSVIHEWNYDKLVDKLVDFIGQNKIEEIVLGWPKNMDGTAGPRPAKCETGGEPDGFPPFFCIRRNGITFRAARSPGRTAAAWGIPQDGPRACRTSKRSCSAG